MIKSQVTDDDLIFRQLLENSYSGFTLFDKELHILYRSPSAERITGWTTANRLENSLDDITYTPDREKVNKVLQKVLQCPNKPITCTFRSKHFDGHIIWLENTFTNLLNEPGINAIVCNFRDITGQISTGETLHKAIQELSAYKYALDEAAIVAITDQKGVIKYVNDYFCKISKYSREELIGQTHRVINSGYHDKAFFRNMWVTIASGKIWKGEIKNKAKDGTYYWVDATIIPLLNEKEKPYQYIAIRSDITERKLSQEKIVENEQFIKTITDNLPAMIAYWTDSLHCLFANKAYLDWFEKTPDEMIGINKRELMDDEEYAKYESYIKNVLHGHIQKFERTFYKDNGQNIYTHTQYVPDIQNGHVKGFYSLIYDYSEVQQAISDKKKLEVLLDKATTMARIGSWEWDVKKGIVFWSAITKEIHEVGPDFEPTFEMVMGFYSGENKEVMVQAIEQALNKGLSCDVEVQITTAKGNVKWIRVISEVEFKDNECIRVYGSFQDIDGRKKAEMKAIEALKERNTILESIDDAFFAVDKNWTVTYWNKMAEKVLRKTREEMLDHNLWKIFSESINSVSYKKYHKAIKTNQAMHFEDYYPPLNKWYEISAYPSVRGLSVYFKDVTERKISEMRLKHLNLNLKKQAKALAVSNAELEQFAYVASHDLQEPLRMVTSFLTQIEKKYGDIIDDKGKQYIHFAVDGAKRMRQIILDLLEFSRVGRIEENTEEVDVNKLINDIMALYRKQIEEQRARITFTNLPVLQTYKVPLRQVFQNLVSNSLKYQKAGATPVISIGCAEDDIYWKFSVKDNGIGIDPEYSDKIFIIFQRLHNKDEYSGTGMGLAVTKKIIENMGGKIWLESEEGKGSTFYFTILKDNRS